MKIAQPNYCKGCIRFNSAGVNTPKIEDYNAWCTGFGKSAKKALPQCKVSDMRVTEVKFKKNY